MMGTIKFVGTVTVIKFRFTIFLVFESLVCNFHILLSTYTYLIDYSKYTCPKTPYINISFVAICIVDDVVLLVIVCWDDHYLVFFLLYRNVRWWLFLFCLTIYKIKRQSKKDFVFLLLRTIVQYQRKPELKKWSDMRAGGWLYIFTPFTFPNFYRTQTSNKNQHELLQFLGRDNRW